MAAQRQRAARASAQTEHARESTVAIVIMAIVAVIVIVTIIVVVVVIVMIIIVDGGAVSSEEHKVGLVRTVHELEARRPPMLLLLLPLRG